jgi:hypothetical protein
MENLNNGTEFIHVENKKLQLLEQVTILAFPYINVSNQMDKM